jgi:short-subunit dehydrogenase
MPAEASQVLIVTGASRGIGGASSTLPKMLSLRSGKKAAPP